MHLEKYNFSFQRIFFTLLLTTVFVIHSFGQKKKVVYQDTLGNSIELIELLAILNTGHYKMYSDESDEKTRYLKPERTTQKEFDSLAERTKKRFLIDNKIGSDFTYLPLNDINRKSYTPKDLKDKILIINFWFVGCGPCEIEMPELNRLYDKYKENPEVIFISLAKSSESKIRKFLDKKQFNYPVASMDKAMVSEFKIAAFPTNYIIGKDGKYHFASRGIGAGSVHILEQYLKSVLNK